jgi:hypothetical protein
MYKEQNNLQKFGEIGKKDPGREPGEYLLETVSL